MKAKNFFMIILALSAMVMSMSSCSYAAPYMDSPYYGAEEIEGPWSNNGYTIREMSQYRRSSRQCNHTDLQPFP